MRVRLWFYHQTGFHCASAEHLVRSQQRIQRRVCMRFQCARQLKRIGRAQAFRNRELIDQDLGL